MGVVFDDLRVPNKLTITEIDKVFLNIFKHWNSDQFFNLIQTFELPKNNQISTFSRGMRMKAALAIALSHDTKLLILDEATAGMDVSGREEVLEILEDYVSKGMVFYFHLIFLRIWNNLLQHLFLCAMVIFFYKKTNIYY